MPPVSTQPAPVYYGIKPAAGSIASFEDMIIMLTKMIIKRIKPAKDVPLFNGQWRRKLMKDDDSRHADPITSRVRHDTTPRVPDPNLPRWDQHRDVKKKENPVASHS